METTNATAKYEPNRHVIDLVQLVEYSRQHPEQLNWPAGLNAWERNFVPTILGYQAHIAEFQPTAKQLAKIITIVEKIAMQATSEAEDRS